MHIGGGDTSHLSPPFVLWNSLNQRSLRGKNERLHYSWSQQYESRVKKESGPEEVVLGSKITFCNSTVRRRILIRAINLSPACASCRLSSGDTLATEFRSDHSLQIAWHVLCYVFGGFENADRPFFQNRGWIDGESFWTLLLDFDVQSSQIGIKSYEDPCFNTKNS